MMLLEIDDVSKQLTIQDPGQHIKNLFLSVVGLALKVVVNNLTVFVITYWYIINEFVFDTFIRPSGICKCFVWYLINCDTAKANLLRNLCHLLQYGI